MKSERMYEESIRRTQARLRREIFIGRGAHSGELQFLKPDDYEYTNTHIVGPPGMGKSKELRGVLLQGFSDFDVPTDFLENHGEEADNFLAFLNRNPRLVREKRIVHFKPGSPSCTLGLNPFASGLPPADVASLVLESLMKAWGADSYNDMPRLQNILRLAFYVAAFNKSSWEEVFQFLLVGNRALRLTLIQNLPDEKMRDKGTEIEKWPLAMKQERFESSANRVDKIVFATSAARRVFERQERILDIRELIRRRQCLVGDLSALGSTEAESLIGAILVNMLYQAVRHRPKTDRSFRVFAIDEFPQFVTSDLARSLDQFRKFGVHLILSHQRLAQLPPDLQSALLSCAKIRFVFGGLEYDEAAKLAKELFAGEVRGDRVKHITYRTGFRPILTQVLLHHSAEADGNSESDSDGWSDGSMYTDSDGSSYSDQSISHLLHTTHSFGAQSGRSSSRNSGRSHVRTEGVSEAYVTEHEEFIEEGGRQFWQVNEQWEHLTARVMNLEKREALVKVFNQPVLDITTPDVRIEPVRHRRKTARQRRLEKRRREEELWEQMEAPPASKPTPTTTGSPADVDATTKSPPPVPARPRRAGPPAHRPGHKRNPCHRPDAAPRNLGPDQGARHRLQAANPASPTQAI
jgi:hypothetical protein